MSEDDISMAPTPFEGEDGRAPSRWRRLAIWAAAVLGALAVLVAGLSIYLNSEPGKRMLVRQIGKIETASGLSVQIGRIEGSIYSSMTIYNLVVRDPQGVFLASPRVRLDWRPFAYVRNHILINELTSPLVVLVRPPQLKPVPSDPDAPLLPDLDIDVGDLTVDRLLIGRAVTGRTHELSLEGEAHIADGRARLAANAQALGGDRLTLRLDASPEDNRLDIDGVLNAPADGLIAGLAGFDRPVAATLSGKGNWEAWQGSLSARSGDERLADIAIVARDGSFAVKGDARPGLLLEGPVARLTSPALQINLAARLEERRADLRLRLRSDAIAMSADGLVDLARNRFGNLAVDMRLLSPGSMAENLSGRDVRARLVLDGDFATPFIAYDINAARLVFDGTGVEGLRASGRAEVNAEQVVIPVNARAARITGLNAAAGGILRNVRVSGDFAYAAGRLISDNLKIDSDRMNATAVVLADLGEGVYRGMLEGRINDYRIEGFGTVNLTADVDIESVGDRGFGVDGRFGVRTAKIENETVRDLFGGAAVFTGRIGMTPEGAITLTQLSGRAPDFRLSGSGRYEPGGAVRLDVSARSTRYGPLALAVRGTAERPQAVLRAESPGLGVGLRNLVARVEGEATGYHVDAEGDTAYGPLLADVLIRSGREPLTIDVRRARFAGVDLDGSIRQAPAGPFAGTLRMKGSGIEGTTRLAGVGDAQAAYIDATVTKARLPGDLDITIGRALIDASLVFRDTPQIDADIRLANATYGEWVIRKARAKVDYSGGRGRAQLVADGSSGMSFDIAANAALSPNRYVVALKGSADRIDFRFRQPAVIRRDAQGFLLEPATLVLPHGSVRLAGRLGDRTALQSRFEDFDLAIINTFVPGLGIDGRATGSIDFSQNGSGFPSADARVRIANFTRSSLTTVSEPVDIQLLGTLAPAGRAEARALIRRGGTTYGRLVANVNAARGGGGWISDLAAGALDGGVRYNGPAAVLFSFAGQPDQQLTGPIALAADFSGSPQYPQLNGVVRADALVYENETFGTRVSAIELDGRFTNDRLVLNRFNGRAGEGTVNATGTVGLAAADGFPINIKASLNRARLARSDNIGTVVSGSLAVTNSPDKGALISGKLRLPELRYRFVREGSAEVARLSGVHRRGEPVTPEPDSGGSAPSIWNLDIAVRADNQIFVSGMGMESEWSADLRITGTTADPRITGSLDLLRGTYGFAGRRFTLDEGEIDFTGGEINNPVISIQASTSVENVNAILNISGRAQNPQIAFTSTPSLPQDEVMSRILFGESVTNLSATQAIQLAASLNSLRGGGGGLNPLGKLQSAAGIDRLRILGSDPATGRETAVAAGQYITNDVYVEIITDARGFTATQLEVALSKALSILTQTGGVAGTSVNLRYSKDY